MPVNLQHWRRRNRLTQVDASVLLGVSQPYLSLLEKGARPVTAALRSRLTTTRRGARSVQWDDRFRAQLSALGCPAFAHVTPTRVKPRPDAFLLSVLTQPTADARVVDALPWVVRRYAGKFDVPWMVRQAKLQNLQNRLGFLLQAASGHSPESSNAIAELDRARLLAEDTLCWDSMPEAARRWMRENRTPAAAHWNIVTTLRPEESRLD